MSIHAAVPRTLIVMIAALGAVIIALFCAQAVQTKEFTNSTVVKAGRLRELRGEILHLDEVLTMAAYMASATSDPHWTKRYREHEPVLARAITEFKTLLPDAEARKASAELELANNRLVLLEDRALSLASQGQSAKALSILNSDAYLTDKKAYSEKLDKLFREIHQSVQVQAAAHSRRMNVSLTLSLTSFALLLVLLFAATRRFQSWRKAIVALIAQLRAAEETIAMERNGLEERVRERTAELDLALANLREEALRRAQAQDQAEAASEMKSRFLAVMTHELKTPLNAIAGFASLLSNSPAVKESEKLARQVKNIQAGSEHMRTIVGDLLDLDKIESGHVDLELSCLNLPDLVQEVTQFIKPIADQREIVVETVFASDTLTVEADAGRVRQILLNLLGNCIKFTTNKDTIIVRVEPGQFNGCVRISVTDHGPGLAKTDHEAVFEQYVQSGSADQRRKGNGLGLPLSRELAKLHGGYLWVESEGIGSGCSFVFELPEKPERAEAGEPKAA